MLTISRLLGKSEDTAKPAHLGSKSKRVYCEKRKRWVDPDAPEEIDEVAVLPPPTIFDEEDEEEIPEQLENGSIAAMAKETAFSRAPVRRNRKPSNKIKTEKPRAATISASPFHMGVVDNEEGKSAFPTEANPTLIVCEKNKSFTENVDDKELLTECNNTAILNNSFPITSQFNDQISLSNNLEPINEQWSNSTLNQNNFFHPNENKELILNSSNEIDIQNSTKNRTYSEIENNIISPNFPNNFSTNTKLKIFSAGLPDFQGSRDISPFCETQESIQLSPTYSEDERLLHIVQGVNKLVELVLYIENEDSVIQLSKCAEDLEKSLYVARHLTCAGKIVLANSTVYNSIIYLIGHYAAITELDLVSRLSGVLINALTISHEHISNSSTLNEALSVSIASIASNPASAKEETISNLAHLAVKTAKSSDLNSKTIFCEMFEGLLIIFLKVNGKKHSAACDLTLAIASLYDLLSPSITENLRESLREACHRESNYFTHALSPITGKVEY